MAEKSYLQLVEEADRIASTMYPDAVLVAADGRPSSGRASLEADSNEWLFIFHQINTNESVTIHCLDDAFDPSCYHSHPALDVMHEPLPRTLGLDWVIELARNAGFNNDFKCISVFNGNNLLIHDLLHVFKRLHLYVCCKSNVVYDVP